MLALLGYAGLAAWLTWPLPAYLTTHLPATQWAARMDPPYMAAILAHETRALLSAPSRLPDAGFFHPEPRALFYGDTGFGALPYFLPIFYLTGNPTLALNLLFLGCATLSGWALYLVVLRWTGSQLGGLIAGWVFLTSPWIFPGFVSTAPSYAVLQYFPFIVLLAAMQAGGPATTVTLAVLVILQCLADVVYVAPAVLVPLGVLAVERLVRRRTRRSGLNLVLVLGLAVVALLPVYLGHLSVRAGNPDLARQTFWPVVEGPPVLPWGPFETGAAALAGGSAILIALGAAMVLVRWRSIEFELGSAWKHAAFWALLGIVISLPPGTRWYRTTLSLPPGLLSLARVYQVLRVPSRLRVASLIGIALLTGLAFSELERLLHRRASRRSLAVAGCSIAALLVAWSAYRSSFERWPPRRQGYYPIAAAVSPDSRLIDLLRQPGGPLLELPIGPGREGPVGLPANQARAMYRAIYHGRPVLNGYSSYYPAAFPARMELARRLPDPAALEELHRDTGLEMILVHADQLRASERLPWTMLSRLGGRDDLSLVAQEGDDLLFRVNLDSRAPQAPN